MTIPHDKVEAKVHQIIEDRYDGALISDDAMMVLYIEAQMIVAEELQEAAERLAEGDR